MDPDRRLVLAGIMGRYPVGGVAWCALQYIAGFQRLGWEVFYLEDTGECGYDPVANAVSTDPAFSVRYIRRQLERVGLEDDWVYIDYKGRYHGASRERVARVFESADLMVNLSGGCWHARDEYAPIPKIFIDTDPGFTQRAIADAGEGWYREFFIAHDVLFTFALNVRSPECELASTPLEWHPTVQPVVVDFWPVVEPPSGAPWTTILSWRTDSFPGMGKGKSEELMRMLDLPALTPRPIRLAIAGMAPVEVLRRHGWDVVDAIPATIEPDDYRAFVQRSRAELGFTKAMYVETRSGWFSDRTQCYLASGRPAVVRDTGFGGTIPTGEGLLTWADEDGLLAGMEAVEADYDRHRARAREIAEAYFSAEDVLRNLLQTAGIS